MSVTSAEVCISSDTLSLTQLRTEVIAVLCWTTDEIHTWNILKETKALFAYLDIENYSVKLEGTSGACWVFCLFFNISTFQ